MKDCMTLEAARSEQIIARNRFLTDEQQRALDAFNKVRPQLYLAFDIKDERSTCSKCGRACHRTFDGRCFGCHVVLFTALGLPPCKPFPVGA